MAQTFEVTLSPPWELRFVTAGANYVQYDVHLQCIGQAFTSAFAYLHKVCFWSLALIKQISVYHFHLQVSVWQSYQRDWLPGQEPLRDYCDTRWAFKDSRLRWLFQYVTWLGNELMSHALWQGRASASLKELTMWLTLAVTVPSQKNENKTDHADKHTPQLNRSRKRHIENIQDLTTQRMLWTTGRVTQKQTHKQWCPEKQDWCEHTNEKNKWWCGRRAVESSTLEDSEGLSLESVSKLHKLCIHCCIIASRNVSEQ